MQGTASACEVTQCVPCRCSPEITKVRAALGMPCACSMITAFVGDVDRWSGLQPINQPCQSANTQLATKHSTYMYTNAYRASALQSAPNVPLMYRRSTLQSVPNEPHEHTTTHKYEHTQANERQNTGYSSTRSSADPNCTMLFLPRASEQKAPCRQP